MTRFFPKTISFLVLVGFLTAGNLFGQSRHTPDDAGMWLLPQLKGPVYAEMKAKGLKVPASQFYSADSATLNKAIVRVNIGQTGGATGSFVSSNGLILTNHHVAFDAIASASTVKQNYLKNGYIAHNEAEEIPAKGYTLYIPIEEKDVTNEIQSRIPSGLSAAEHAQREQEIRQELISKRKGNDKDLEVEIDDLWAGNKQYMIVYRVIRDVRIVFAPPLSIGKYGGNIDNWMWPRHTGDFSFLRAYVAPDGSGRPYNKNNVPYHPQRFLKISLNGYHPGSFTMIMGFPGSTYRHQSSYAFDFYEQHRNPYLIDSFKAILDGLEYAANHNPETAVANASDRADFANELKYFQGVQKGFKKYHIVQRRRDQEKAFQQWIQQKPSRKAEYSGVLDSLKKGFQLADKSGDLLYSTYFTLNYSKPLKAAALFNRYYHYLNSDTATFDNAMQDSLLAQRSRLVNSENMDAELLTLKEMLEMLANLPADKQIPYIEQQFGALSGEKLDKAVQSYLNKQLQTSIVFNAGQARGFLNLDKKTAKSLPKDDMLQLYDALRNAYISARQTYVEHFRIVAPARMNYVKGMMAFRNDSTEYPDANFTARMTGGRIMGYYPEDGVYYLPRTTLNGVIAKNTGKKPFNVPKVLMDWYKEHVTPQGTFEPHNRYMTKTDSIIVCFLSTNDITGGNSGSPVMNANGNIIGIAFDGNIEGVVGDYFFDPNLNRTISVDIRYVLFLTDKIYHVERVMNELHIVKTPAVAAQ